MTTDGGRVLLWLGSLLCCAGLIICVYSCVPSSNIRHGDTLDVSRYPQEMQDAYQVFATRCSRCHTLARPLNARIHDPQHWVRYVERMRLNASSGINAKNGQTILRFLLYYMQQRDKEQRAEDQADTQQESDGSGTQTQPPAAADVNAPASAPQNAAPGRAAPAPAPAKQGVDSLAEPAPSVAEPGASEMNP
ncbi:MAG: hypothetical protein RL701_3817 [Pseudomonadota bacterium]